MEQAKALGEEGDGADGRGIVDAWGMLWRQLGLREPAFIPNSLLPPGNCLPSAGKQVSGLPSSLISVKCEMDTKLALNTPSAVQKCSGKTICDFSKISQFKNSLAKRSMSADGVCIIRE